MGLVHALVAEVLAHLVDTLEASDDETLQIELCRYAHVHVLVERVEVGYERACARSACYVLQYRCVHLSVSGIVEDAAHGAYYLRALQESLLHAVVDDEVDITLAVAQLRVVERIEHLPVLLLHDRERLQRF